MAWNTKIDRHHYTITWQLGPLPSAAGETLTVEHFEGIPPIHSTKRRHDSDASSSRRVRSAPQPCLDHRQWSVLASFVVHGETIRCVPGYVYLPGHPSGGGRRLWPNGFMSSAVPIWLERSLLLCCRRPVRLLRVRDPRRRIESLCRGECLDSIINSVSRDFDRP